MAEKVAVFVTNMGKKQSTAIIQSNKSPVFLLEEIKIRCKYI
jgi:hypothetical protein